MFLKFEIIEINRHLIWPLSFNIFEHKGYNWLFNFAQISSLREPLIIPGIVSEFHILV